MEIAPHAVSPEDFLNNDSVPPRIGGTECEYSVHIPKLPDTAALSAPSRKTLEEGFSNSLLSASALELYFSTTPAEELGGNHFAGAKYPGTKAHLRNGGKIYIDCGNYPEYCTPETRSPIDVGAADLAGIITMQGLARRAHRIELPERGRPAWYLIAQDSGVDDPQPYIEHGQLYRRTGYRHLENQQVTVGFHDNHMLPRSVADTELCVRLLEAHIATAFLGWSGVVGQQGYELSQKAKGIGVGIQDHLVNRTDEGKKALAFLLDDREVTRSDHWRRLEVRAADAPFSPWANVMRSATTSLVLRLAEHPDLLDPNTQSFAATNPVALLHQTSHDVSLTATSETTRGAMSALDVQEMLATACAKLAERVQLPVDEQAAIGEWLHALGDARQLAGQRPDEADFSKLGDRVEWAARHTFIRDKLGHLALTAKEAKVVKLDLLWDRVKPTGVSMTWWKERPNLFRDPVMQRAESLISSPPADTRAHARGELVKAGTLENMKVDWYAVHGYDPALKKYLHHDLEDPYYAPVPKPRSSANQNNELTLDAVL